MSDYRNRPIENLPSTSRQRPNSLDVTRSIVEEQNSQNDRSLKSRKAFLRLQYNLLAAEHNRQWTFIEAHKAYIDADQKKIIDETYKSFHATLGNHVENIERIDSLQEEQVTNLEREQKILRTDLEGTRRIMEARGAKF